MRRMMLWLAGAAALLPGCASVGPAYQSNIDFDKVARIETAARAVGVSVYWVNYPTKPASAVNQ